MKTGITGKCIVIVVSAVALILVQAASVGAGPDPTEYEQYLLELINRGRLAPADEAARYGVDLNEGLPAETITTDPKQPLAFNPFLTDAARNHSQWMLDQDTFDHTGDGGSTPSERMAEAGYVFSGSYGSGENIGFVATTGEQDQVLAVGEVHGALYRDVDYPDRGHRVSQLNPVFKEVGSGVRFGVYTQQALDYNAAMVTENFAYSAGSAGGHYFITGVAWQDTVVADGFYTPGGEGVGDVSITATNLGTSAEYTTTTWASGGYGLAVPDGTYDVVATAAGLDAPIVHTNVMVASQNVKRDFVVMLPRVSVSIGQDIANGDDVPNRDDGTHFGSVGLGNPGVQRVITVRNIGGEDLLLSAVELPAGFTLLEELDTTIPVGGHDTFSVQLDTASAGTHAGSVRFSTNDPARALFTFAITGRVNPPGAGVALAAPLEDVRTKENGAPLVIDLRDHFDDIGVDGTLVRLDGNLGSFDIELTDNVTPVTVRNFLNYVADGDYTDTFVHRAVTTPKYGYDFIIQTGGYAWPAGDSNVVAMSSDDPIVNEFTNWFDPDYGGLAPGTPLNVPGTVAMAKLGDDPDSATNQFFVNLADNSDNLDNQNGGFTVFGTIARGQATIDAIADLPVYDAGAPFNDLPLYNFPGGTISREHVVLSDTVAVIDELVFTITANSNPDLVTPTIGADGTLALTFAGNQTGLADITVQATDRDGGMVADTFRVEVNVPLPDSWGDVNADGAISLEDAILILRVLSQSAEAPPGLSDRLPDIDVNADGKLGLAEVAFILQKIVLLR